MNGLPNRRKLRIHVIQEVEQHGFRCRRLNWGSELLFSMMAQNEVFQCQKKLGRKIANSDCLVAEHTQADGHMTHEAAFVRVVKSSFVRQFVQFAEVM